jgi:hypothetical protein
MAGAEGAVEGCIGAMVDYLCFCFGGMFARWSNDASLLIS